MRYYQTLAALGVAVALVGAGCETATTVEDTTNANTVVNSAAAVIEVAEDVMDSNTMEEDAMAQTVTSVKMDEIVEDAGEDLEAVTYEHEATLEDVTADGDAVGSALIGQMEEGTYVMMATFEDLLPLEDDFFYEGWLVRKEPFGFISTGEVELSGITDANVYLSDTDLGAEYDRYVLTLEPNDGDPAPAEHIVEGDFVAL